MASMTRAQRQLVDELRSRDPDLTIRWDEDRSVASVLKGGLLSWDPEQAPEDLLEQCLRKFGALIGPSDVLDNYEYVGATTSKAGHLRVKAMQTAQDLPIYGATLLVFADRRRGVFRVQSGFYRDVEMPPTRLGAREVDFSAREAGLAGRLRRRLEADPEGARFARRARPTRLGVDATWEERNFPLTQPPKLWLYPTKGGLRRAFRVTAYQPIAWSDAGGVARKAVDVADVVIDATTGRIIEEGGRLGMAYTDTTGDGLSTLKDDTASYIVRALLVVQQDGGHRLLINRTHTPHIITHDMGGTATNLEQDLKNGVNISEDADGHWSQTTTSCTPANRVASQQPEVDGHYYADEAHQFYQNLGWAGFDDGGWGAHCPIRVATHIGTDANAFFWRYIDGGKHYGYLAFYDGTCSAGSVEYDFIAGDPVIFAHEYQHAITYFGAADSGGDPGYLSTSGWHRALHEGLSDLMACLRVGIWVTPAFPPDGVAVTAAPFRRIEFPRSTATNDGQPNCDHYDDRNLFTSPYEHSTILSHAAFLAGQGGVHQRIGRPAELIPVRGTGRDSIAEIFHYAVTEYFDNIPPNSVGGPTMIEAANFVLDAAEEVTGSDRSCEYVMLRRAFYAVGLYPYDDNYNKVNYGGEACMLPWTIGWRHSRAYLGFPALWYKSPDLFINNGSGPEYNAVVGQENKLFARVRNIGDEDLSNVRVRFRFRAAGTNLPSSSTQWKECCDQAGDPCILDIPLLAAGSMNFTDENNPPASQAVNWYLDPAEVVQGLDHFCVRAVIECEASNHDHDCPSHVQSNISYTEPEWGETLEFTFLVANWEQEDIPLDLQVEPMLPEDIKLEYVGRTPLERIRLRPREELPLPWRITTPERAPRQLAPPYDGKVVAKARSTEVSGVFEGELSGVEHTKGPRRGADPVPVHIEGMLSGAIDGKALIAGKFDGELDATTGAINGRLVGNVYRSRRRPAPVRLTLRGCLEPSRAVHFSQRVNGEPVGGVTVKVRLPRLSRQLGPEDVR